MDESLTITVSVQGKEYSFDAKLVTIGYTHRLILLINGLEVIFEPDEERHYRAIMNQIGQGSIKDSDREMIEAVAEKIESIRQ